MGRLTAAQMAENRRASDRARESLKIGDRLRIRGCGGTVSTVTLKGWDDVHTDMMFSASRDEIHAMHIDKVNGLAISFADPRCLVCGVDLASPEAGVPKDAICAPCIDECPW